MKQKVKKMLAFLGVILMIASSIPMWALTSVVETKAANPKYSGISLAGGIVNNDLKNGTPKSLGFSSPDSNIKDSVNVAFKAGDQDIDGITYPGYLDLKVNGAEGTNKVPTAGYYKFAPTKDGDVTLAFKINAGKTYYMRKGDGTEVDSIKNSGSASLYVTKTYTLTKGEEYYIYVMGGSKIILYGMTWAAKAVETEIDLKKSIGASETNPEDTENNITYLDGFKWSDDGGKEGVYAPSIIEGTTHTAVTVNRKNKTTDIFTNATTKELKGAVPTMGVVKYVPSEDGLVNMEIKINAKSDTDNKPYFAIVKDSAGNLSLLDYESVASSTYTTKEYEVKYGNTYYFGQANGSFVLFKMKLTNGTKFDLTPWSDVAAPTITAVDKSEGTFKVTVNANVNKYKGAQAVYVTALLNGGQAGEQKIVNTDKDDNATVTIMPYASGDYKFYATAVRTGESNKVSTVWEENGYVLSVRAPKINWVQNKGNGSVYIDWVNIADAANYTVSYREKSDTETEYTEAATVTAADYTLTGLTAEKTYEIKVIANRADGEKASDITEVKVTEAADQDWYVATVGSAQATTMVFKGETEDIKTVTQYTGDTGTKTSQTVKSGIALSDIKSIDIAPQDSGKISDDEDGFSYYYTKIDPRTENFVMKATFEITDTSKTPDNQSGFGIVAADTVGMNYWGPASYTYKYFNYFSSMLFSATKQSAPVMRYVTGYTSSDPSNKDGVERTVKNDAFSQLANSAKSETGTPNYIKDAYKIFEKGNKFTFEVSKTDAGYTAYVKNEVTGKDQTLNLNYNDLTSVQEDGTVAVGLMCSRKIGVNVSNISFTKSASTGLKTAEAKEDKVTPGVTIYSSNTVGADTYTFTGVPNCAGTLKISSDADSENEYTIPVTANQVVRQDVKVNVGSNTVTAVLTPTESESITSADPVTKPVTVTRKTFGEADSTLYVATNGSSSGTGTSESPLDLQTAVNYAQPGQTIIMKNGVYTSGATIGRSVSGTADKAITLKAESISKDGTDGVVLKGSGLNIIGSYWKIYGLYVKDANGVGIQISGNNNTIEMCTVNHASNSGVQISRSGSADNAAGITGKLWPSDNLVLNCESFDNCDATRNDADGFAAKLTCGNGNVFDGCIGHNNIDDGWDLYAKSVSGMIGKVVIRNCVAYNNGWLSTDDITASDYDYGEGNGFKLGGGYLKGGHELINSVTYGNYSKGVASNSCPDCVLTNVTSYGNGRNPSSPYSIGLNTMDSMLKEWKVSGLISMTTTDKTKTADMIPFSLEAENNYIYNGSASYNSVGDMAKDEWFERTDLSIVPTRNEDGSINMHGMLVLKATAPAGVGARINEPGAAADYTAVNAAKTKAAELKANESIYVDFTKVDAAVNAVVEGKLVEEQDKVDAMAKAIEDAIKALVKKDADYTAVNAAKTKAAELKAENYVDFTGVTNAVEAVVEGKKIDEQAAVDAMAKAIEDAIKALVLKDADYTAVNAAKKKAAELKSENYVDFTGVTNAVKAVVEGKKIDEQAAVDAMAKVIDDAIKALVLKDADYTAVNAAKKKAAELKADEYKNFDTVTKAVKAVVEGKKIDEQAAVDAMAKAINDAITGLVKIGDADYTAVDAAIKKAESLNKDEYEDFTGVTKAISAVVRGKKETEQTAVDAMAKAINDAIAALVKKQTNGVVKNPEGTLSYVENGEPVKSKDVTDDKGNTYRADADGKLVTGFDKKDNDVYYFEPETGAMAKGITIVENEVYNFDEKTGIGSNGFVAVGKDADGNDILNWFEDGKQQGVKYTDAKEGKIDETFRGKEIYDPKTDAWYWLDNVQNGQVAKSKDVYQESLADAEGNVGKWVRYDADGHMVKDWDQTADGTYYFDPIYGTMAKGDKVIDGVTYHFDEVTGKMDNASISMDNHWETIDGVDYWFEGGVRQGYKASAPNTYRGKEIYDPASDAWYWLDNVDGGRKAVSKDVYQESLADDKGTIGKWVRYDENGHMIKGWNTNENGTYYFDLIYGTMLKGTVTIDGVDYTFDEVTGILK